MFLRRLNVLANTSQPPHFEKVVRRLTIIVILSFFHYLWSEKGTVFLFYEPSVSNIFTTTKNPAPIVFEWFATMGGFTLVDIYFLPLKHIDL